MISEEEVADRDESEQAGVELLRALARAVFDLSACDRLATLDLPYPESAQRALDRLVLASLERGDVPPAGVPELVRWCAERTAKDWPITVPSGYVRPDARLIDPVVRMPTRACAEIASDGREGTMERQARDTLAGLEATAASADEFQRQRDFLIDKVAVTSDLPKSLSAPMDLPTWSRVGHLYRPIHRAYVVDGRVAICPTCGLLALPSGRGTSWCESETCPRDIPVAVRYRATDVRVLGRPLRLFLSLPGRTERSLRAVLKSMEVETLPVAGRSGVYRLRAPYGDGPAVWISDRTQAALLATRAAKEPASLCVVPDRAVQLQPDYREEFERTVPVDAGVSLITDQELITAGREGRLGTWGRDRA